MLENSSNRLWREPHRRLVENKKARIGHQRATDGQHLLFATRERTGELIASFSKAGKLLVDEFDGGALPRG